MKDLTLSGTVTKPPNGGFVLLEAFGGDIFGFNFRHFFFGFDFWGFLE